MIYPRLMAVVILILVYLPPATSFSNEDEFISVTPRAQHVALPVQIQIPKITPIIYTVFDGETFAVLPNGILSDANGYHWKLLEVITTAYTYRSGIENETTATLQDAIASYGIASCPGALPYGTLVHVPNYGTYIVDDCGRIPNEQFARGNILLDLRIPHRRYDGVWRSEAECVNICNKHGVQHTVVLVQVN